jgi:signal transduction histidine kinase
VKTSRGLERFCSGRCYVSYLFVRPSGHQTVELNRQRLEHMYPGVGLYIDHLYAKEAEEAQKKKEHELSTTEDGPIDDSRSGWY